MEIDPVLGQEPWLDATPRTRGVARLRAARCVRSDGRSHSCVVARPTTAPGAETWSIPTSCNAIKCNGMMNVI